MLTLWWKINESLNNNRFSCTFCVCINAVLNQISFIMMDELNTFSNRTTSTFLLLEFPCVHQRSWLRKTWQFKLGVSFCTSGCCRNAFYKESWGWMCAQCASDYTKPTKRNWWNLTQILSFGVFLPSRKKAWMVFGLVLSYLCPCLPLSQNQLFNNNNISNFRIKKSWTADFTCKFVLFAEK